MTTKEYPIDFRVVIPNLPTMSEQELSKLKLWTDEQISFLKGQLEVQESADADIQSTDWWRRAKAYTRKLGHLMLSIQEERTLRKKARHEAGESDVNRKFVQCLRRAMAILLTADQCDKVLALALEIQKMEAA